MKVADGYARNYLLPRKLALAVTENNKRQIEREKKLAEAQGRRGEGRRPKRIARAPRRSSRSRSRGASARTRRCTARSRRPTSPHALQAKGFEIDKRKIQLPDPLKALGETTVPVKIHRDVTAQVKVKVVAEQEQPSSVIQRTSIRSIARTVRHVRRFIYHAVALSLRHLLTPDCTSSSMPDVAAAERTLPHNLEAEKSVLGAILIHNEAFNHAAELIDSRDFFRDAHRRIFDKMVALSERSDAIDLVTLKDELQRARASSRRSAGPPTSRRSPTACRAVANVEHYARIVKEKATLRNLIHSANRILADGLRGRGGRRPDPRRCREGDLRDRRGPHPRRASCRCAISCRAASRRSRSCSSTRGWSPACRPASSISTR